jgi:hypothetical protein
MKLHEIYDTETVIIEMYRDSTYTESIATIDDDVFRIRITRHTNLKHLSYLSVDFSKKGKDGNFTMDLQLDSKISTVTSLISAIRKCYQDSGFDGDMIIGSIEDNHKKREKFYKILLKRFGAKRVGIFTSPILAPSTIVYGIINDTLSQENITQLLKGHNLK